MFFDHYGIHSYSNDYFGAIKQCSSTKIESDELKTIALSSQNLPKPEPPCITINLVDSVTSSNNSITMNAPIGH